eukprot:jgi/Undpi1/13041/HiC_scaffold_8.g02704.m1
MVRVAVGQMTSTSSKQQNFDVCAGLVKQAVEAGASFLALPECFNFIGGHWTETVQAAEPLTGPSMTRYRNLAKESGLWLSLGGFQEEASPGVSSSCVPPPPVALPAARCEAAVYEAAVLNFSSSGAVGGGAKVFNTHVVISGAGEIEATYRKIHLFDVDIPSGPVLTESRYTRAGQEMTVCDTSPAGTLGLSTCYDLRFPEMYACLAGKGSQVLLVPSAFTVPTGKAHWEVLLRARAIEAQAYVIASAQVGQHNEKRASYGHSLIVDPWGEVLADAGDLPSDSPCIKTAEIDLSRVADIRMRMPVGEHRRAAGPLFAQDMLDNAFGKPLLPK